MPDIFYPSVDISFIEHYMLASGKLAANGIVKVGTTTIFVLEGQQAIYKRTIYVRELQPGQVCFEQATGLAARFGFMGALLNWFEDNRKWKDGAYII